MIWQLEWRNALRARRLFTFNVLVPLGLVAPVALSDAPRAHAAMVDTLLIVFFGTFGSAIPLVRDAASGLFGRMVLAGIPEPRLLAGRIVANAAIDTVQLFPALLLIAVAGNASSAPILIAAAAFSLVTANAMGAWIAAITRSIAEAALFAAVIALFALHLSGVFRTPAPGSPAARIESLVPLSYLHDAVRAATGPAASGDGVAAVIGTAGGAVVALLTTSLAAHVLTRALLRTQHS